MIGNELLLTSSLDRRERVDIYDFTIIKKNTLKRFWASVAHAAVGWQFRWTCCSVVVWFLPRTWFRLDSWLLLVRSNGVDPRVRNKAVIVRQRHSFSNFVLDIPAHLQQYVVQNTDTMHLWLYPPLAIFDRLNALRGADTTCCEERSLPSTSGLVIHVLVGLIKHDVVPVKKTKLPQGQGDFRPKSRHTCNTHRLPYF